MLYNCVLLFTIHHSPMESLCNLEVNCEKIFGISLDRYGKSWRFSGNTNNCLSLFLSSYAILKNCHLQAFHSGPFF